MIKIWARKGILRPSFRAPGAGRPIFGSNAGGPPRRERRENAVVVFRVDLSAVEAAGG